MSKKTVFTTITPLPAGISRHTVMETLHDHLEMIDLAPTHESRVPIRPPPEATPEEYHCTWYLITDKISYIPGVYSGKITFKACFHDLAAGLQTHCYAPIGVDIKEKWTLGGNLPGEPVMPVELGIGVPMQGLYLREDVELRCNFLMTRFVRKTLQENLKTLVARLVVKSQLVEAGAVNRRLTYESHSSRFSPPNSPPLHSPTMSPPLSPPLTGGLSEYERQWSGVQRTESQASHGQLSPPSYGEGSGSAGKPERISYLQYMHEAQQYQLQQQRERERAQHPQYQQVERMQQQRPGVYEMDDSGKTVKYQQFPAVELEGSTKYKD